MKRITPQTLKPIFEWTTLILVILAIVLYLLSSNRRYPTDTNMQMNANQVRTKFDV